MRAANITPQEKGDIAIVETLYIGHYDLRKKPTLRHSSAHITQPIAKQRCLGCYLTESVLGFLVLVFSWYCLQFCFKVSGYINYTNMRLTNLVKL